MIYHYSVATLRNLLVYKRLYVCVFIYVLVHMCACVCLCVYKDFRCYTQECYPHLLKQSHWP